MILKAKKSNILSCALGKVIQEKRNDKNLSVTFYSTITQSVSKSTASDRENGKSPFCPASIPEICATLNLDMEIFMLVCIVCQAYLRSQDGAYNNSLKDVVDNFKKFEKTHPRLKHITEELEAIEKHPNSHKRTDFDNINAIKNILVKYLSCTNHMIESFLLGLHEIHAFSWMIKRYEIFSILNDIKFDPNYVDVDTLKRFENLNCESFIRITGIIKDISVINLGEFNWQDILSYPNLKEMKIVCNKNGRSNVEEDVRRILSQKTSLPISSLGKLLVKPYSELTDNYKIVSHLLALNKNTFVSAHKFSIVPTAPSQNDHCAYM